MSKSTEPFRRAILESLSVLIEKGCPITNKNVVNNAVFSDGKPVGKSTIYRKSDNTGEFIHKNLLLDIQKAKDGIAIVNDKPTKTQTVAKLTEDKQALSDRNDDLVDQVVEQEFKLKKVLSSVDSDRHVATALEMEMYVIFSVLIAKTPSTSLIHKQARDFVDKYERKTTNADIIKRAKSEVIEYIRDIRNSTLVTPL
jgi:hypothetical protein